MNMQPTVTSWSSSGDEFSLVWDQCPLSEWVEMPSQGLKYCALIPGAIRGALQMVQLDVQCWFVQVKVCLVKPYASLSVLNEIKWLSI